MCVCVCVCVCSHSYIKCFYYSWMVVYSYAGGINVSTRVKKVLISKTINTLIQEAKSSPLNEKTATSTSETHKGNSPYSLWNHLILVPLGWWPCSPSVYNQQYINERREYQTLLCHSLVHTTLKSWVEPGDAATYTMH